eukprot:Partr_v1_DN27423_c0_g1_i3_m71971 putative protein kinase kinase kinase
MNLLILLILLTLQFSDAATPNLPVSTVVLTVSDTNEGTPRFTFSEITGRYYVCNVLGGNWTINTYDGVGARLKSVPLDLPCMKVHVDENENVYLLRGITDNMHFDMLDSDLNLVSSAVYAAQSMKLSGNTMWLSGAGQNNFIGVAVPDFIPVGAISVPGIVSISDSAIDSAGYYYVFGLNALSNATIVKFDSAGIPVWTKLIPTALVRSTPVSINYNPVTDELICSINSFGTVLSYPSSGQNNGYALLFSVSASNGQLSWSYRPEIQWSLSNGAVIDTSTGDTYFAYTGDWVYDGFGYMDQISSTGLLIAADNRFNFYMEILITQSRIVCALQDRGKVAVATLSAISYTSKSTLVTQDPALSIANSARFVTAQGLRSSVLNRSIRISAVKSHTSFDVYEPKTVTRDMSLVDRLIAKYLLVSFVFLFSCIAICVSTCMYQSRSKSRKSKQYSTKDHSNSTESAASTSSDFPNTTTTSTTVNTDVGLAFPAYLHQRPIIDFASVKELTRGGAGIIFLARPFSEALQAFGPHIIVKQVTNALNTNQDIEIFNQEVTIMNDLKQSPYIATILGYADNPHSIIMKYYQLGSLRSIIKNPRFPVTKRAVNTFSSNIASGLHMMHSRGIAHCDIKLDNILLDRCENGNLKCVITDFGVSCIISGDRILVEAFKVRNINGASIQYAAPETLKSLRDSSTFKVDNLRFYGDIYSWSMVLYALMHRQTSPWI